MLDFIKKYWDIVCGVLVGILLAVLARFELTTVQLWYSVIILILVSIGVLRCLKQAMESNEDQRNKTIIDRVLDDQKSMKAINLAQEPLKKSEDIAKTILTIWEVIKNNMEKIKTFFSKFKGYILTAALAILTIIEMCGGYINSAFGGVLTINGIEVIPLVTLACTVVIGIISNGYTKEQQEKIKALLSTSATNDLVKGEIKKAIKEKTEQLTQYKKQLATKDNELAKIESTLVTLNNTLAAKKEMLGMLPQLATEEEVKTAADAVNDCIAKIVAIKAEIIDIKAKIENTTTTLNALKSQIK